MYSRAIQSCQCVVSFVVLIKKVVLYDLQSYLSLIAPSSASQ